MDKFTTEVAQFIMFIAKLLGFGTKESTTSTDNQTDIVLDTPPVEQSGREKLYQAAKSNLGIDLTPKDEVQDFVACVAQMQALLLKVVGSYIGSGGALYNTRLFRDALQKDSRFETVSWDDLEYGDICAFASGESPVVKHGHVFIVGKVDWMSNNSYTGKWEAHKTKQQVYDYYIRYARFTPYGFRLK